MNINVYRSAITVVALLCLAREVNAEGVETGNAETGVAQTIHYVCRDGSDFSVRFDRPELDESPIRAASDQVILTDTRNHSAYRLARVRSASGEKYSNGEWTFWSRGEEAMVQQGDQTVYSECRIEHEQ